jgi:hypothetical protein
MVHGWRDLESNSFLLHSYLRYAGFQVCWAVLCDTVPWRKVCICGVVTFYRLPKIVIAVTTLCYDRYISSPSRRNRCFASSRLRFGATTDLQMAGYLSNGAGSKSTRKYFPLVNTLVWIVTPCSCVEVYRRLGGKNLLHLQGGRVSQIRRPCHSSGG